jgi:hypothetical protein
MISNKYFIETIVLLFIKTYLTGLIDTSGWALPDIFLIIH